MAWYTCPFEKGRLYRVIHTIGELGHNFVAGETVRFTDHSYDAKQGVIRFWFQDASSTESKAWHVWESEMESLSHWGDFFDAE
jgi:hypothetical protein